MGELSTKSHAHDMALQSGVRSEIVERAVAVRDKLKRYDAVDALGASREAARVHHSA